MFSIQWINDPFNYQCWLAHNHENKKRENNLNENYRPYLTLVSYCWWKLIKVGTTQYSDIISRQIKKYSNWHEGECEESHVSIIVVCG